MSSFLILHFYTRDSIQGGEDAVFALIDKNCMKYLGGNCGCAFLAGFLEVISYIFRGRNCILDFKVCQLSSRERDCRIYWCLADWREKLTMQEERESCQRQIPPSHPSSC